MNVTLIISAKEERCGRGSKGLIDMVPNEAGPRGPFDVICHSSKSSGSNDVIN